VAPEAWVGGPLALLETGDLVTLDVPARTLHAHIPERTLADRRDRWLPPPPRFGRGYGALFTDNVTQANEGCDFAFLAREGAYPEPDPS
jgi:dihydroxy-acid dehydratase